MVAADNITLDLNGHTVSGTKREMEQAGILLQGVRGVTVRNGTVRGFDAGVAIEGGSGNTVTRLTVQDNVNDTIESVDPRSIVVDPETGPTREQREQIAAVTCLYGDGITVVGSRHNNINENDLRNVGVTDAAGLPVYIDNAEGSPTRGRHALAGSPGSVQPSSMCGATEIGTPGMGRGREIQSSGIRIEGPGADGNHALVHGGISQPVAARALLAGSRAPPSAGCAGGREEEASDGSRAVTGPSAPTRATAHRGRGRRAGAPGLSQGLRGSRGAGCRHPAREGLNCPA